MPSDFKPVFEMKVSESELGYVAHCWVFGEKKPWGKMTDLAKDPLGSPNPSLCFEFAQEAMALFLKAWKEHAE